MGFIKSLFKSGEKRQEITNNFKWQHLSDISDLEGLINISKEGKVAIFKHSTRCGTSRMVLKSFEKKWAEAEDISFYFLDLIRYRAISNAMTHDFEVFHQSPQLIVLEKGQVSAHASHYDILNIAI